MSGLVLAIAFSATVLGYHHDRFWWPPDDGAYAHVADRMLRGEVLNRDVQDIHAGYINFANMLAFRLFGDDLVSLRYPLVAMGLLQACIAFFLLLPRGVVVALAGAVSTTSLSTVQFLNPTAHWYALFLFFLIVGALTWMPPGARGRLELIGFLAMALLLFRQLTGVIVAIGVLTFLLVEARGDARGRERLLARALLLVMTAGLGGYLFGRSEPIALLLFGPWPLCVLLWAWRTVGASNRQVVDTVLRLGAGGAVAAAPLISYHVLHGSVGVWLQDTVVSAMGLTDLGFISMPYYLFIVVAGARQTFTGDHVAAILNGSFWLTLPLLATVNGLAILSTLLRRDAAGASLHPLPLLAVFYAIVSVHYEIPIYLFYTVAVSLVSLLWVTAHGRSWSRWPPLLVAVGLSAIGLHYQAAQPLSRGLQGIILGERADLTSLGPDRASIWMETADAALYADLVRLVRRETGPEDLILAVPFNPELYFLSRRENPFRFFNTALGVRDAEDVRNALDALRKRPPKLVFFQPSDKYNNFASAEIMAFVRQRYDMLEARGGFEIYRLRFAEGQEGPYPPPGRMRSLIR